MRPPIRPLSVLLLAGIGLGHSLAESPVKVQVGRLVIESNTLPAADRRQVIREFQHFTYDQSELGIRDELGERIREALRDLGYVSAVVDEPMFSLRTTDRGKRIANVTVTVNEGTQYRLGSIEFEDAKLFPTSQMRKLFALQDGDVFNASKFGNGMENLRKLYEAAGYAEAVVVPQEERNEQLHTVEWVLDVQEGWQYHFGRLILDGLEPHAGAAQSLLNSWKTIHGKQYNPIVLQQWLMANRSDWRPAKHTSRPIPAGLCADPITQVPDGELRVVNVKLSFPEISPSDHIDCGGRTN